MLEEKIYQVSGNCKNEGIEIVMTEAIQYLNYLKEIDEVFLPIVVIFESDEGYYHLEDEEKIDHMLNNADKLSNLVLFNNYFEFEESDFYNIFDDFNSVTYISYVNERSDENVK